MFLFRQIFGKIKLYTPFLFVGVILSVCVFLTRPEDTSATAWAATDATYVQQFFVGGDDKPTDLVFNTDGTKMFVIGEGIDSVVAYSLSSAFDVSTASFSKAFSVTNEETAPQALAFNTDGTKMFVIGYVGDSVDEYNLSTGFDISTAVWSQLVSVNSEEGTPRALAFNNDGSQMYVMGQNDDDVNQYDLGTPFDVSTAVASTTAVFADVGAKEATPTGLAFNTDGTKMFVTGQSGDGVNEYALSRAFDPSSAIYTTVFSVSAQESAPGGVAFNNDGTKMYIVGETGDDVNEYTLSVGFDLGSTVAYSQNYLSKAQDYDPTAMRFNTNGTKMFVLAAKNDDVYEYDISVAYDISTASSTQSFSVGSQDTTPMGLAFNSDGTKMFVLGDAGNDVCEYDVSPAFDMSGVTYSQNYSVNSQESIPTGLAFSTSGTKMFVVGQAGDDVNEYTLSVGFDLGSTVTFIDSKDISGEESDPTGLAFNSDGTKMFVTGDAGNDVTEYTLSTGFDVSTASSPQTVSVSSQTEDPSDVAFNDDGLKMYVVGKYVDQDIAGLIYEYSLVSNAAPTAIAPYPSQNSGSNTIVTVTTTIADADSDVTSLVLEYSTDNSTWASSTLLTVTQSGGEGDGVVTSTGSITDIDTDNDGSVDLTIEWNIGTDAASTDDSTVYFRIIANDGTVNGSTMTSPAFAVDTEAPSAPGALTTNTTSTTAVDLAFGAQSTDTNFKEYKIFYKAGASGVTQSDTGHTSSTDANLGGNVNYGGVNTTTISGLSINTQYVFNIWAYDDYAGITAAASELALYTLANAPGALTAGSPAATTLDLTLNDNSNSVATTYAIYEVTTGNYVAADDGLDSATPVWQTTSTWANPTVTGLSANTQYTFSIIARNGDNIETTTTTASAAYTLANSPGALTAGSPATSTLTLTLNDNSNPVATTYAIYEATAANYVAADNGLDSATPVWQTTSTWSNPTVSGLSADTQYTFSIIARNGDNTETATTTASAAYTLANASTAPTIGTATTTTLPITINVNSNPVATTYAVYNSTDDNYLDADGASTATAVYSTTSTLGSSFAAIGLPANTAYQFVTVARNGNGINAATSTASTAKYTLANTPSSASVAADSTTQITLSWSGDATEYYAENTTAGTNSGWAAGTSFASASLSCGTTYTFRVKGKNGDGTETSWSDSASVSTNSCASSEDSTSGSSAAPAPPAPPAPPVTTAPAAVSVTVPSGQTQSISVGNSVHSVTANSSVLGNSVTIVIESDPIIITLKEGEERLIDTDSDGKNDLFVRADNISKSSSRITLSAIADLEFSINKALSSTDSRDVILYFNSSDSTQFAISNSDTFAGVSFEGYTKTVDWTLTPGNGTKTVYVKLKTAKGGTRVISDTIILTDQVESDGTCPLTPEKAYKHGGSYAVYFITSDCTKRPFNNSNIFFTYFTSWDEVELVSKTELDSIPNDELSFMPYGPKYNPKYGALVKIVKDPKVYLLLGTERYWITSETVFNALNYAWDWIESVSEELLGKYTVGSEIIDKTRHPDHTLIKYAYDPRVYKLENGTKRYIKNEAAFNSLGYRWDRIVTIDDTEIYENGKDLDSPEGVVNGTKILDYEFTSFLTIGDSGEEVKQLQLKLKEFGFFPKDIKANAYFGRATEQAVKDFQAANNIDAVGYVGPGTREALNG